MPSDSEEYEVDVNGPRSKRYMHQNNYNTRPDSNRRPSDTSSTTNPRYPSGVAKPQNFPSYGPQRTPDRRPSIIQSSSSFPASSPLSRTTTGGNTASTSATDYSGSSPIAPSPSELRRTVRQPVFESQLSGLLEEFASLASNDYKACYAFAKEYPEIWDFEKKLLLRDALDALKAEEEPHAEQCVQRAVMIQYCAGLSSREIKNWFDDLIRKKPRILNEFLQNCNDATANIKAKIPSSFTITTERPSQQDAGHVAALGSMSLGGGQPRRTVGTRPDDEYPAPTTRMHQNTSGSVPSASGYHTTGGQGPVDQFHESTARIHRDASNPMYRQSGYLQSPEEHSFAGPTSRSTARTHTDTPTGHAPVAARGRMPSGAPTIFDSDGRAADELDSRYVVKTNSAGFFTIGRVFATPWHTALGANNTPAMQKWVVKDCFGESILTHIQRMVVVKEGHGFSWCVPITTYQGKGVAKKGLSDEDRRAHAIIYMEGTNIRPTAAERDMMDKESIAVHAAATDQKLDPMSRINFGKVHTIEHNVKVMNVGRISRDDLEEFKDYWNQHR